MPISPPNPHDAYFRKVFGSTVHAAVALRAVLRVALPAAFAARLDRTRLELVPGSFVSAELQSRYSDLLFRTLLDDRDAFIFLLVEHHSRSDRFMPLRMVTYLVRVWTDYLNEHAGAEMLPAVVPMVVHVNHTGRAWRGPTELSELIDLDPVARTGAMTSTRS